MARSPIPLQKKSSTITQVVIMGQSGSGKSTFISKACATKAQPTNLLEYTRYQHTESSTLQIREITPECEERAGQLFPLIMNDVDAFIFYLPFNSDFIQRHAKSATLMAFPNAMPSLKTIAQIASKDCYLSIVVGKIDLFKAISFDLKSMLFDYCKQHFPRLKIQDVFLYTCEADPDGKKARGILNWIASQTKSKTPSQPKINATPSSVACRLFPDFISNDEYIFNQLKHITFAIVFLNAFDKHFGTTTFDIKSGNKRQATEWFDTVIQHCFTAPAHIKELIILYESIKPHMSSSIYVAVLDKLAKNIVRLKFNHLKHLLRVRPSLPCCGEPFYFTLLKTYHGGFAFFNTPPAQKELDRLIKAEADPTKQAAIKAYFTESISDESKVALPKP